MISVKKDQSWIVFVCIVTFLILLLNPIIGIIGAVLIFIYLVNHGFFDRSFVKKPTHIPQNPKQTNKTSRQVPPKFLHKIEFLSSRELVFSNFSSARYLEENGSHKMVDVIHPNNAKICIRLNNEQFDVYIVCDGKSEQLSFEKSNLKILDITNHSVSMIEGNKGESYLKIQFDHQFFTTLEVEALIDFFEDFSIENKTTKFQEKSVMEEIPPKKPNKNRKSQRSKIIFIGVVCLAFVFYSIGTKIMKDSTTPKNWQQSVIGVRKNTQYLNDVSFDVNNELEGEDWGLDELHYQFSDAGVPLLIVNNKATEIDYTHVYDYEMSSFESLEKELSFYTYQYYAKKKQYDFVNLGNGKWYHLSGILEEEDYYDNDTHKKLYIDVYVMPTSKSLVQVTMVRTIDDVNDYDMMEFLASFDFSQLMSTYL